MSDYECTCHREYSKTNHEECCGHDEGRDPDCPYHGDGSGPHACACNVAMPAHKGTLRCTLRTGHFGNHSCITPADQPDDGDTLHVWTDEIDTLKATASSAENEADR